MQSGGGSYATPNTESRTEAKYKELGEVGMKYDHLETDRRVFSHELLLVIWNSTLLRNNGICSGLLLN